MAENHDVLALFNERPSLIHMEMQLQARGMELNEIVDSALDLADIATNCKCAMAIAGQTLLEMPNVHYGSNGQIICDGQAINGPYITISVSTRSSRAQVIVVSGVNGCVHFNTSSRKVNIPALQPITDDFTQLGLEF